MKTTFNKVMQAAVAATVLTFAGASHAADVYGGLDFTDLSHTISANGSSFFGNGALGNGKLEIGAAAIVLANYDNFAQQYVAFCIDPLVSYQGGDYIANYSYQPKIEVRKLFESSYAAAQKTTAGQFAFQLALWDAAYDDGNLTTGNQFYALGALGGEFQAAQDMLSQAQSTTLGAQHYSYVSFNSEIGGQTLMGVSAVPEADTWAMMAVGLGLLGMVGRRKQKNEKFA